jgi:hypothetical protein
VVREPETTEGRKKKNSNLRAAAGSDWTGKNLGAPDTHAWLVRGQSRNVQEKSARAQQRRSDRTGKSGKASSCTAKKKILRAREETGQGKVARFSMHTQKKDSGAHRSCCPAERQQAKK